MVKEILFENVFLINSTVIFGIGIMIRDFSVSFLLSLNYLVYMVLLYF